MALAKKAERKQINLKVLLMSPSGGGKTYSALRLAKGFGGKTVLIDTEAGRGLYYANEFDYDYLELKRRSRDDEDYDAYKAILGNRINEPYAPENYIELIKYCVKEGYDNIIIDSLTHEWTGEGGILDSKEKMTGNDFTKWGKLTPRHDAFIYEILHSPVNIIATVRGKDQYVLEDKNGKQVPKKIGLGATQRDGMEYEYTVTFNVDQESHVATVQKDNTHLFEGRFVQLTEDDGEALIQWAGKGLEKDTKKRDEYIKSNDDVKNQQTIVADLTKEKVKVDKNKALEIVKNVIGDMKISECTDLEKLKQLEADLTAFN